MVKVVKTLMSLAKVYDHVSSNFAFRLPKRWTFTIFFPLAALVKYCALCTSKKCLIPL